MKKEPLTKKIENKAPKKQPSKATVITNLNSEPIRLDKFLAHEGVASRREAKVLIQKKLIRIGKKLAKSGGDVVEPKAEVTISGVVKKISKKKQTVIVYKPRGFVSSKDADRGVKNIFTVFPIFSDLNCVGRLDKESEGLIVLSNDGLITKAITGKDHLIEKEYVVTVREDITPAMMKRMSEGVKLRDGWTKKAEATKVDRHTFRIVLHEGKKHQIRRMANACRLTISSLKRVRIGHLKIGRMRPSHFKKLSQKDVEKLKSVLSK